MFNFSGISNNSIAGKLLRSLLLLIPKNSVFSIKQGKLKRMKWITGSGNHGCWLGSYEFDKQQLFSEIITMGSTIYDIGANVGFYTLLSSKLAGNDGMVYSFEPNPLNINYLNQHIKLNNLDNVKVFDYAVSDNVGFAFFENDTNSSMGYLSNNGKLKVKTTSLDYLYEGNEIKKPDFIKIDVEGAELSVLKGAEKLLKEFSPILFLATHGEEIHINVIDFLENLGYKVEGLNEIDKMNTDELIVYK